MRDPGRVLNDAAATFTPYTLPDGRQAGEIALIRQRNTDNEPLFVGLYRCAEAVDGTELPYEHNESFIVLEGEASITLSDGVERQMRPGDMVTIAKGEVASVFWQSASFRKFFVLSD